MFPNWVSGFIHTDQTGAALWSDICLYKPVNFLGNKPEWHNLGRDYQAGEKKGKKMLIIQANIFNEFLDIQSLNRFACVCLCAL